MLTNCPTCHGSATVQSKGDLHRSPGEIPCPNPNCLGGYVNPPEHDILILQYLMQAILQLASLQEREDLARSLSIQSAAYPRKSLEGKMSKRQAGEIKIAHKHRAAIEAAIALILR